MLTHGMVSSRHEKAARAGANFMDGYARMAGMPETEGHVKFYLSRSIEETCREIYGDDSEKVLERHERSSGWAHNDFFVVKISRKQGLQDLIETVAHEMSHCLRSKLRTDGYTTQDPYWLDEGIAEYHAVRVASESLPGSYERNRENLLKMLGPDRSLIAAETKDGFLSGDYAPSFFAAEFLAYRAGEKSLFDFYSGMRPGASVDGEFNKAFGISTRLFYALFKEHQSEGFPRLDFPKNYFS